MICLIRPSSLVALLLGISSRLVAGGGTISDSAEPTPMERETGATRGHLSLYLDNDLASQTDENYTNGLRLAWLSSEGSAGTLPRIPGYLRPVLDATDCCGPEDGHYSYGVSLTQQIYTPQNIQVTEPLPGDRPYAGWLALGVSVHERSERTVRSLELSLGVVGPSSLGEDLQNAVHGSSSSSRAQGWDNQLSDEPTINLFVSTSRRYELPDLKSSFLDWDIIGNYGVAVGNVLTGAQVGGKLRLGYNLPNQFANHKLSPTAYHFAFPGGAEKNFSLYAFAGASAKLKAWEIFLDGNTYKDSLNVNKRYVVGEFEAGVGLRYKHFNATYTHSFRSEEFEGQKENTSYGAIAVSFPF